MENIDMLEKLSQATSAQDAQVYSPHELKSVLQLLPCCARAGQEWIRGLQVWTPAEKALDLMDHSVHCHQELGSREVVH